MNKFDFLIQFGQVQWGLYLGQVFVWEAECSWFPVPVESLFCRVSVPLAFTGASAVGSCTSTRALGRFPLLWFLFLRFHFLEPRL